MTPEKLTESNYPISFRKTDASALGDHLKLRHSVELIGMKRVGISNFLRFFLNHPQIVSTYISKTQKHLFVPIDLNDLVERELHPFWILTLKRLADIAESAQVPTKTKDKISTLFLQSIQIQDNFLTIENIKKSLILLLSHGFIPTLFFVRFDRIRDAATPELFTNIQGLIDSTNQQLSIVFTSNRPLDQIRPDVFKREDLMAFSHMLYLLPANMKDSSTMFHTVQEKYESTYSKKIENSAIELSGGHMQYLYLVYTILLEKLSQQNKPNISDEELKSLVIGDERIRLQSEEIFEGLTNNEKDTVKKCSLKNQVVQTTQNTYLFDTGIIKNSQIFSPIFADYLEKKQYNHESIEFSKKEHLLYTLLQEKIEEICDRDTIIHAVWPESEEMGVSDWTIDRLVARLRHKLEMQKSKQKIVTIKTRGYKLVQS